MARVGRLADALLVETAGAYYLVGNPKVPCDWMRHGFEPPGELDAVVRPVVRLVLEGSMIEGGDVRFADEAPISRGDCQVSVEQGSPAAHQRAARALGSPQLVLDVEGEALPRLLAEAFVIARTGSVSERLWRLVTGESDDGDPVPDVVSARWLGELPPAIWQIVRDTVLRCS